MKKICLILVLLLCLPALAESLWDGGLTLKVPEGFQRLDQNTLRAKFPGANPPEVAYGNSRATATMAITRKVLNVPDSALDQFRESTKKSLQQSRPDIRFQEDRIVPIGGKNWIRLVFMTPTANATVRNEMLLGSEGGFLYMINMNATSTQYPGYAKAFDEFSRSLRI